MTVVEQERVQTEVTVREVLHRAADLLEEFGWCQHMYCKLVDDDAGDYGDAEDVFAADRFCMAGALIRAASELTGEHPRDGEDNDPWLDRFYAALHPEFRSGWVAGWNDEPGRTRAEVVARLRQAAEAA